MINIPDVNVLIALSWKNHIHHKAARTWFTRSRNELFATCPITECGFVRLSMNISVVGEPVSFEIALQALQTYYALPNYKFLPLEYNFRDMTTSFHLSGHRQTTDAYLLGTAIKHQGKLVSFDKKIKSILSDHPEAEKHLLLLHH